MFSSHVLFKESKWFSAALVAVLWLLFSFSFYAIMYTLREVFRVMTYLMGREFLLLSEREHYFFNFFYAAVACIVSFGFLLNNFLKLHYFKSSRPRHKLLLAINGQSSLNAYFLLWFGKLGVIVGFWYAGSPVFYYVSFYKDYYFLFLAIPVVLFLHQWMGLRLAYKGASKWMMVSAVVIAGTSFLFSRINLTGYEATNNAIIKNLVPYNYQLELPDVSEAVEVPWYCRNNHLYLCFPKTSKDHNSPVIVMKNGKLMEISHEDVRKYVDSLYSTATQWEFHPISLVVSIDKRVRMGDVKTLKSSMAYRSTLMVYFSVLRDTPDKRYGLREWLRPPCDDLMEVKNISDRALTQEAPTNPCLVMVNETLKMASFRVSLKMNEFLLADTLISATDLYREFYAFLIRHKKQALVELDIDEESDFDHYMQLKDLIRKGYNDRRDELARLEFGESYPRDSYHNWGSKTSKIMDYMSQECPVNIIEWTDKERILVDSLRSGRGKLRTTR